MESFTFHGIILKGVLFSGTFTYYNYFYCLFGKRVYTRMKQAVRRPGQPSTKWQDSEMLEFQNTQLQP